MTAEKRVRYRVGFLMTLALVTALASADDRQEKLRRAGLVGIGQFAMVKYPSAGETVSSDQLILGTVMPWSPQVVRGKKMVISPSPLQSDLRFKVVVQPAAELIETKPFGAALKGNVAVGEYSAGGGITITRQIKLTDVFRGRIVTKDDRDRLEFFMRAKPFSSTERQDYVWVTQFIAATIDNLSELKLDANSKAKLPKGSYEVTLEGGTKRVFKGPGLIFAVQPTLVSATRVDGFTTTMTAGTDFTREIKLSASGTETATLAGVPTSDGGWSWRLAEYADTVGYGQDDNGDWKRQLIGQAGFSIQPARFRDSMLQLARERSSASTPAIAAEDARPGPSVPREGILAGNAPQQRVILYRQDLGGDTVMVSLYFSAGAGGVIRMTADVCRFSIGRDTPWYPLMRG